MKKIFLLFAMIAFASYSYGQFFDDYIDFEGNIGEYNYVTINAGSDTNNIWQIGIPGKTIFDSAYSATHAIMTDSLNPYPINDTSSFILTHLRPLLDGGNESLQLNFWFKFNSDTLTDYGKVELSNDKGNTWINLMSDDLIYGFEWIEAKPVLSGNTNGWQHFSLELRTLTYELGYSDTLLYRFTFISDNNQTNKDGWMIDNFDLVDSWEGIAEIQDNSMISIYPNPVSDLLDIKVLHQSGKQTLQILNETSQVVYSDPDYVGAPINTSQLRDGMYILKFTDDNRFAVKKFVVKH